MVICILVLFVLQLLMMLLVAAIRPFREEPVTANVVIIILYVLLTSVSIFEACMFIKKDGTSATTSSSDSAHYSTNLGSISAQQSIDYSGEGELNLPEDDEEVSEDELEMKKKTTKKSSSGKKVTNGRNEKRRRK